MARAVIDPGYVERVIDSWFGAIDAGEVLLLHPGEPSPDPESADFSPTTPWAHLAFIDLAGVVGTTTTDEAQLVVTVNIGSPRAVTALSAWKFGACAGRVKAALSYQRSVANGHDIRTEAAQYTPDPPGEDSRSRTGVVVVSGTVTRMSGVSIES